MVPVGLMRHGLTLENPTRTPDTDGGYTETWTAIGNGVHAGYVRPANIRDLERIIASSVQTRATHLVTIWYRSAVSTSTRLTFHDMVGNRSFEVTGVHDEDERHIQLTLTCVERGV